MKISVALATYNGEKYIIEQLESIMNQTVPVDEVIIADDCSIDNTVRFVTKFIEDHNLINWTVFVNDNNLGFSRNFFKATNRTTGDVVLLADQDDVWLTNKVENLLHFFKVDESVQVVASGMMFIDSKGNTKEKWSEMALLRKIQSQKVLPYTIFIGSSVIPGCTYAFRSTVRDDLVHANLPNLNRSLGHDWLIAITGATLGKFVKTNDVLIKRRIHESNASKVSLRKTTALSTNLEKRVHGFQQTVDAHNFLLETTEIANRLSKTDISRTKNMIRFFKNRIRFAKTKNLFIWFYLGIQFKMYLQCAKMPKVALQLYVADFLYTYNINWKIKS
jgi:glycosyltransferase involved in cell wall biosynthesis